MINKICNYTAKLAQYTWIFFFLILFYRKKITTIVVFVGPYIYTSTYQTKEYCSTHEQNKEQV